MSVYFIHILKELLSIGIIGGLFSSRLKTLNVLISILVGYIFSYIAFFIAKEHLKIEQLYFIANTIIVFSFIFSIIFICKLKIFDIVRYFLFVLFSFGYFIRYFYLSNGFNIFSSNFLDDLVVISTFFIVLALLFTLCILFLLLHIKQYNKILIKIFMVIFILIAINLCFGDILLYLSRYGIIDNILANNPNADEISSNIITYIAKIELFYDSTFLYLIFILLEVLALNMLRKLIKNPTKKHILDIDYRKNLRFNKTIFQKFFLLTFISISSICINLYYVNIESKPIQLSQAVTPTQIDDDFVFDIQTFRDNDLHRYAYITPSGKKVRFFIINKFTDKDSPSVVFDACSICGDMGYVLKNNEIICVACGVRVFRPSIGKSSGCNPIPVENVTIKDGKIYVPVDEIIAGESFFSEKVAIEVIDPVDGSKFLNEDAEESEQYYGKTYYFKTIENYEKFKENPEKYIKSDKKKGRMIISDFNKRGMSDW